METFADIAAEWLEDVRRTRRPKTHESYCIAIAKLYEVVPEARERYITRQDLIKFRDKRADDTSVLSANRDMKSLKACLNWAWVNELPHPQVPLKRLLLPPPPRKDETLTPDQVALVFEAAQFDVPALVVLKICHATGMRLGEVLNLTWSDVDVAEGCISVTAKPWWQPKTQAALRTVYAQELVRWLDQYRSELRFKGPKDRVCQMDTRRGKPWTKRVHSRLRAVYDRAEIRGKKPSHALRHTVASDLVQSGAPIHVAQKQLGHASASVTLGIYAHAQRKGLAEAGRALEDYRRRGGG